MRIEKFSFSNFRNIESSRVTPAPGLNVFWGGNAQGKTNFLEGLYLFSHLKSFRPAQNGDLLRREQAKASLSLVVKNGEVTHRLALEVSAAGKAFLLNEKKPRGAEDLLDILRQVAFTPEDILVIKGSPAQRRAFLDRALFQVTPGFLVTLQTYNRYLKQRNSLLKRNAGPSQILPWTEGLIEKGIVIRAARADFLREFMPFFRRAQSRITSGGEIPAIKIPWEEMDHDRLREGFFQELSKTRERETLLGTTLAGPHRDDMEFQVNDHNLRQYGSQGQQRTFVLAFKTALVDFLKEKTGKLPVLLLDDLTSELDPSRNEFLLEYLLQKGGQIFLTTTSPRNFPPRILEDADLFEIRGGEVLVQPT